ncbi:MAG TPA: peptide chain release factor 2, partial [Clostridiales bacterium]|nr:peptide chain release factor 2 [Clostridiales bacterium]
EKSKAISQKISIAQSKIDAYDKCDKVIKDALDVIEYAEMEDDDSLLADVEKEINGAEKQ